MAAPRGLLSCHRLPVLSVTPESTRQTALLHPHCEMVRLTSLRLLIARVGDETIIEQRLS
jgi:hypothetical protein